MKPADRRAVGASAAALALCAAIAAAAAADPWTLTRSVAMTRGAAWVATSCLLLTLAISPLGAAMPGLRRWRRPLGIATALTAAVHAGLAAIGPLDGAVVSILSWPQLRTGALALGLLALLLLTSFPRVVRLLRIRHWKALHRTVYGVAALVVLHAAGAPSASVAGVVALTAGAGVLLASRAIQRGRGG